MFSLKHMIHVFLFTISCDNLTSDSATKGATGDDIARYENARTQENGRAYVVQPAYERLASLVTPQSSSQEGTPAQVMGINLALFLTYDRDNGNRQQDYATKVFAQLKQWLTLNADSGGMIKRVVKSNFEQENPTFLSIEGFGDRPQLIADGGSPSEVYWKITVNLGTFAEIAPAFGRAIADNQIVILNGHFYEGAYMASQMNDLGMNDGGMNVGGRNLGGGGIGRGGVGRAGMGVGALGMNAQGYTQAWDQFKAHYKGQLEPYRIVVINGCQSENLEEMVIKAATELNQTLPAEKQLAIDIMGHRGKSNFRHFGAQISRFLGGLVNGEDWKFLMNTFVFSEPTNPALLQMRPHLKDVTPVLRRYPPSQPGSQL